MDMYTPSGATVFFPHDYILSYIYQTTSQVPGVSGAQSGIYQAFASTIRGNNILSYRQTFPEVGFNW